MKKSFNVGDICSFDPNNELRSKEHEPTVFRIMKKRAFNRYECIDVSEISPIIAERFRKNKIHIVNGKYLTKINQGEKIVVRLPVSLPVITDKDIALLESIITTISTSSTFGTSRMNELKAFYSKMKLYYSMKRG